MKRRDFLKLAALPVAAAAPGWLWPLPAAMHNGIFAYINGEIVEVEYFERGFRIKPRA